MRAFIFLEVLLVLSQNRGIAFEPVYLINIPPVSQKTQCLLMSPTNSDQPYAYSSSTVEIYSSFSPTFEFCGKNIFIRSSIFGNCFFLFRQMSNFFINPMRFSTYFFFSVFTAVEINVFPVVLRPSPYVFLLASDSFRSTMTFVSVSVVVSLFDVNVAYLLSDLFIFLHRQLFCYTGSVHGIS